MKRFLVLYATRTGHTRRIAKHLADNLSSLGFLPEVVNAAHWDANPPLGDFRGAILVASVHRQKHEPEMSRFVKRNKAELERIRAAFLSVSLSQAGAENTSARAERREKSAKEAQGMIDRFLGDTGWLPFRTQAVAGALLYTKYNFLVRYIMRRIARQEGGDTDTSKDYEYTDWKRLDDFVVDLTSSVPRPKPNEANLIEDSSTRS